MTSKLSAGEAKYKYINDFMDFQHELSMSLNYIYFIDQLIELVG